MVVYIEKYEKDVKTARRKWPEKNKIKNCPDWKFGAASTTRDYIPSLFKKKKKKKKKAEKNEEKKKI